MGLRQGGTLYIEMGFTWTFLETQKATAEVKFKSFFRVSRIRIDGCDLSQRDFLKIQHTSYLSDVDSFS